MARDTPDESVPLEIIIPGNTKRESVVSSRFVDLSTDGLSNGHSNAVIQKPLKLKNLISKGEAFDSLHQNSSKVMIIVFTLLYLCLTVKGVLRSNNCILIENKKTIPVLTMFM